MVIFDRHHPSRHHVEGVVQGNAGGKVSPPKDVVFRAAVGLNQPLPDRKVMPLIVVGGSFVVSAEVDDRDGRQSTASAELHAGLVDAPQCPTISLGPIRDVVRIVVVAADAFVQVQELGGGDRPVVQRLQPVLHAQVIVGATAE